MADAWNRGCGCGWGWGTKMGSRKPNASLVIPPPSRRGHGAMGPPGMAWDEGTTDTAHSGAHCPVLTIFCFPLLRHLPINAWASRKGPTNTTRLCRLTLYTVRLGQDTPRAPPSIHRRRKPAFLNCSTAGVHFSRQSQARLTSPPPPRRDPSQPLPSPSSPSLLLLSCHTSTTRTQTHPSNPSPSSVLLFPSSPSPSPPNVAVMSLARPGPVVPLSRRPGMIDWIASSRPCFPSPSCPDAIDVIAPPTHRDAQGCLTGSTWALPDHVPPGEPPLPRFLTKQSTKESRKQCAC